MVLQEKILVLSTMLSQLRAPGWCWVWCSCWVSSTPWAALAEWVLGAEPKPCEQPMCSHLHCWHCWWYSGWLTSTKFTFSGTASDWM